MFRSRRRKALDFHQEITQVLGNVKNLMRECDEILVDLRQLPDGLFVREVAHALDETLSKPRPTSEISAMT